MSDETRKYGDIAREVAALDALLRAEFWRALRDPDAHSLNWKPQ